MKKLFVIAASAAIVSLSAVPAYAEAENVIAVIDSGFEAEQFGDSIVEEVCVTATRGCNNRRGFDIGDGAAGSPVEIGPRSIEDWSHGTFMVQTILETNPDAKIVLVRNSKTYGRRVFPGTEKDFQAALNWVSSNADTYNIVAVSFSRGSHQYVASDSQVSRLMGIVKIYQGMVDRLKARNSRLAPLFEAKLNKYKQELEAVSNIVCPVDNQLRNTIIDLQNKNVATIVATGNDADKTYADYPSCIDEAVAVTAADSSGEPVYVANVGANTDFSATAPTTSEATAIIAAKWAMMYNGSYNSTYELMESIATNSHSWSAKFVQ